MGDNIAELMVVLKCLIKNTAQDKIQLKELIKIYQKQECENLEIVAERNGFVSVLEMISSFSEFKITKNGLQTFVQIVKKAPTTEMNKQSSVPPSTNEWRINYKPPTRVYSGPNLVKTIDMFIPKCIPLEKKPDFNEKITIRILDLQNPHRFWFAEHSEFKKLNELMENLNEFYSVNGLKVPKKDLQKGLYAAVLYGELWHRGFIVKVWPGDLARVFYVDFGTVGDVSIDKIRFLTEDFLAIPSFAQRGVLSHVQPTGSGWSSSAVDFFRKTLNRQNIGAKIFKKNESDLSYYLALRFGEAKDSKLMTNMMIDKGFCAYDPDFMERKVINEKELPFIDYENGKHLKDREPVFDSWLPSATPPKKPDVLEDSWMPSVPSADKSAESNKKVMESVQQNNLKTPDNENTKFVPLQVTKNTLNNSSAQPNQSPLPKKSNQSPVMETNQDASFSEASTIHVSLPDKSVSLDKPTFKNSNLGSGDKQISNNTKPSIQRRLRLNYTPPQNNVDTPAQLLQSVSSLGSPPPAGYVSPTFSERFQIEDQTFCNFEVGKMMKIYIHVVKSLDQFYFYVKDEMLEIRQFLKDFNKDYEADKEPNDNFVLGIDVATFYDDNFCRGRIVEKVLCEESYKVFLLDYGVTVDRAAEEIFKLRQAWMKRKAAVYVGELAIIPEHAYIKSRDQFAKIVDSRFVRVKITRINDNSVELLISS